MYDFKRERENKSPFQSLPSESYIRPCSRCNDGFTDGRGRWEDVVLGVEGTVGGRFAGELYTGRGPSRPPNNVAGPATFGTGSLVEEDDTLWPFAPAHSHTTLPFSYSSQSVSHVDPIDLTSTCRLIFVKISV